jgi:di/tricarboxylate transporter
MLQDQPVLFHSIITLVGVLLYLLLWRITSDLPAAVRYLSRMALAVVMLAPILLALFFGATTPKGGAGQKKAAVPAPTSAGSLGCVKAA